MVLPGSKILGATELKKVFRHAIRESSALSGHLYGHCSGSTLLSTAMAFLDHRLFYGIFSELKRASQDLIRSSQGQGLVKSLQSRDEYRICGIANLAYSIQFKICGNANQA